MRGLSAKKTKFSCVRHCRLHLYSISISTPVCIVTHPLTGVCFPEHRLCWPHEHVPCHTTKQLFSVDIWLKALEDVFVYRGSERRCGHNSQLRAGTIPPCDKYCHKFNSNLEVRTIHSFPIWRIQTANLFTPSPKFIINSSNCKCPYPLKISMIWSRTKDHR
jgi:hypothetical protein